MINRGSGRAIRASAYLVYYRPAYEHGAHERPAVDLEQSGMGRRPF
jgi:hypothetical protein